MRKQANNNSESEVVLLTDIDNTLYDFVDFYARAFRSMVHALASELSEKEDDLIADFKRIFRERGSVDQSYLIEYLTAVKNFTAERTNVITSRGRRAFDLTRKKHLRPYEEMPEVLKALYDGGVKIVAVTNAPFHYAFTRLRSIGVLDSFFGLVAWEGYQAPNDRAAQQYLKIKDQAGRRFKCFQTFGREMSKPNSYPFELVQKYFDTDADYFALGDSIAKDLAPARVLNAKMIWAKYGTVVDQKNLDTIIQITPWSEADIRLHKDTGELIPDFVANKPSDLLSFVPQRQIKVQQLNLL